MEVVLAVLLIAIVRLFVPFALLIILGTLIQSRKSVIFR
jgi:hypothetical protein